MNDKLLQELLLLLRDCATDLHRIAEWEKHYLFIPAEQANNQSAAPNQPNEKVYQPEELMTIDASCHMLRISRSTLDRLRKSGKLQSIYNGRVVRLIREEVLAAKNWYSIRHGKF